MIGLNPKGNELKKRGHLDNPERVLWGGWIGSQHFVMAQPGNITEIGGLGALWSSLAGRDHVLRQRKTLPSLPSWTSLKSLYHDCETHRLKMRTRIELASLMGLSGQIEHPNTGEVGYVILVAELGQEEGPREDKSAGSRKEAGRTGDGRYEYWAKTS